MATNSYRLSAAQCRAARGLLAWTQEDLALAAGVSVSAIGKFEAEQDKPHYDTLAMLRRALELAGVEFIDGDEAGVKMRK